MNYRRLSFGALAAAVVLATPVAHAQNAAVTFNVDVTQGRRPINPNIYGVSFASAADLAALNCPLNRWGGNATSRHNWQQNASNRAGDYFFESISDEGTAPGAAADKFIADARGAGAQPMITIPNLPWVAKLGANRDKLASFSVQKYGAQQQTDPWMPDAGNGVRTNGTRITGNDPNDANTPNSPAFQQGWVNYLKGKWGAAANGGVRYYLMDNETSLWHETHRDVHPAGQTMEESRDGIIAYSAAVKAADAGALVAGPEEWGRSGYLLSGADQKWSNENGVYWNQPDKTAHGGADYLPWLLGQLKQHDAAHGTKSLDIFTVHYYPQGGEFWGGTDQATQLRRNRSTRSMWDPNYTDETWINDKVRLVPRLKEWVNTYYPGLQTGITEYSWGADNHINGATAQADILGIFGREGLDLANRWTSPANGSFAFKAMQMYRNYDGKKSVFGDTAVRVTSAANPDNIAVFASQRTADGALTVMVVNKVLSGDTPFTLNVAGFTASAAQQWRLTAAGTIARLADSAVTGNTLSATLPPQSISLFVLGKAVSGVPTVNIGVPAAGAASKALPAISGTATAAVRVARVQLTLRRVADNKYWTGTAWGVSTVLTTILGGTATNATWRRTSGLPTGTSLPDGAYAINAQVFDDKNLKASVGASLRIDNTPPTVEVTVPLARSVVSSLTIIRGNAADPTAANGQVGSGPAQVQVSLRRNADLKYWNGASWGTPAAQLEAVLTSTGTWRVTTLPTGADLVDGAYVARATAIDRAGNSSAQAVTPFTLRRTTVASIATPAVASPVQLSVAGARADGTIRLVFTGALGASATDGANYSVQQDGAAVELISAAQPSAGEVLLTTEGLNASSRVTVVYSLQDAQGRTVAGTASTIVR